MKARSLNNTRSRRGKKKQKDLSAVLIKILVASVIVIYLAYTAVQLLIFSKKLF